MIRFDSMNILHVVVHTVNPITEAGGSGVQGKSRLHAEFVAIMGYAINKNTLSVVCIQQCII